MAKTLQTKPVKPAMKWPGGKTRLLKHLLPLVPAHRVYAEVFGGGLALLLAMPPKRGEVVNDLNSDLISAYRCLQCHGPEMERLWQLQIKSREAFHDYRDGGRTDIERAVRWLYRQQCSFGADGQTFGLSVECPQALQNRVPLWQEWTARMAGVTLENVPWERFLDLYDRPFTFFFFDPPYVCPDVKAYASFTHADMERLAARMQALKGRWLLTVNDSPENRALWKGYPMQAVSHQSGATKAGTKKHGELIITDGKA